MIIWRASPLAHWASLLAILVKLIEQRIARAITAALVFLEHFGHLRVAHRFAGFVDQQVLLGDIGDVFAFRVFREQMIERLILARPRLGWNRLVPFLGVV